MSGIHLFVPMLHRRDAVGEHTRSLRDLLVAEGCRLPDLHRDTRPGHGRRDPATTSSTRRTPEPGDVLVYQMATRSDIADWLRAGPSRWW